MRFDAYAGNLSSATAHVLADVIAGEMGARIRQGKARRRYGRPLDVITGDTLTVWIAEDPVNRLTYFEAKGDMTPEVVGLIRSQFPQHSVCRVDVAEDFDDLDAFERLVQEARASAPKRIKGLLTLPDDPFEGKTWTLGRRTGDGYLRIYERGKQGVARHFGAPSLVRAEFEIKPHFAADRRNASTMEPLAMLGIAPWCRRVGEALFNTCVPKYSQHHRQYTENSQLVTVATRYKPLFMKLLADGRDWAAIGKEFEAIWNLASPVALGIDDAQCEVAK